MKWSEWALYCIYIYSEFLASPKSGLDDGGCGGKSADSSSVCWAVRSASQHWPNVLSSTSVGLPSEWTKVGSSCSKYSLIASNKQSKRVIAWQISPFYVLQLLSVDCIWQAFFVFCSYMTDGGLGLYTRRLNRMPDSMAAVRETLHRNASTGQGDADRWVTTRSFQS